MNASKKEEIKVLLTKDEYGVTDYKKDIYLILLKKHGVEKNLEVYKEQFGE
jgi:hypothetical protein